MGRFLNAFRDSFNAGRQKAKVENALRKGNFKVIVFETTGEIKLATLSGNSICRENIISYEQCPQRLLNCAPPKIVDFCKETAPNYLYLTEDKNGDVKWVSTHDSVSVKI